ncbi:MAG: PP2C family protein-serine/threonine phosphatase [Phycisphaerales bacterium]
MSNTFTTEFHAEFEAERARWLRKRALWYLGVSLSLTTLFLVIGVFAIVLGAPRPTGLLLAYAAGQAIGVAIYVWAFIHIRRRLMTRERTVHFIYWLIVGVALYTIFLNPAIQLSFASSEDLRAFREAEGSRLNSRGLAVLVGGQGVQTIFITHFFAALFIPWTPREAIRPLIPLMSVVGAVLLGLAIFGAGWPAILLLVLMPLVGVPGWLICAWRHGRFRDRFMYRTIKGRYADMKRELVDARRIHEALFPASSTDGAVRFTYCYEPMRQIGGDFLFRRYGPSEHGPEPMLSVAIIDVTGHGIPAALTVNRLHGELERLFAERPDTSPGELLDALNRYVHLTLAEHSVYVTAVCIKVDPNLPPERAMTYASGGHPPAFLRSVDGTIEELGSTAFVLGAVPTEAFDAGEQTVRFGSGDSLIAYTDGATEARDQQGRMLRIEGMLRLVASPSTWTDSKPCEVILGQVDRHRFGPIADDTLIVEISRPLRSGAAAGAGAAAATASRAPTT